MSFFSKNKKNDKKAQKAEPVRPENERVVYRDGVFEAFEDTNDQKKYGRILKFHGNDKVYEMSEEEFALWSDAAENYGRYRITYERDEDFFIEKVVIEKATSPEKQAEDTSSSAPSVTDEQKREFSELVAFYNAAVQSEDHGTAMLSQANLHQLISCAALGERKIGELVTAAKGSAAPGEKITVNVPESLDKMCSNAKKYLFEKASKADALYVVYSEHTKRPHSAGGCVLVAFDKSISDTAIKEFSEKGQKVYPVEFLTTNDTTTPPAASRIVTEAASCGLQGIRFIYKFGLSCMIRLNVAELTAKLPFPENVALRTHMSAFFQDLRNGVPSEKLRPCELAMYDALFRSVLLQPCMKKVNGEKDELTVAIVKDNNGSCLLELYTSVALMERSDSYIRFKSDAPETSGYKKWTFEELLSEVLSGKTAVNGFIIDKECIPVPFGGATLDKIVKLRSVWENNGKTFAKK